MSLSHPKAGRCPGPSTADIIARDGDHAPAHLTEESYQFLGDKDIPYKRYTSAEFFRRELDQVWYRTWQWACREEEVSESGDYVVYDIGERSVIIIRTEQGELRGFYNACLHRGTQLKPAASTGCSPQLRCPFHGYTWSLQGKLVELPCEWDFPHINPSEFSLPEVRLACWGGFVFINFCDNAESLESQLGVIPDHFKNWDLSDKFIARHVRKTLPANWKACVEAFLESYHVLETHPQGLPTVGDANSQYDVYGDFVSRFVHLVGYPSPHIKREMSEQELLEALLGEGVVEDAYNSDPVVVPAGSSARQTFASHLKKHLGTAYQRNFDHLSITETIDAIEYFSFPNACFFPSLLFPMAYRFRPNGMAYEETIFDLVFLQPLPATGERPDPADPVDLTVEQSFHEVDGFDAGLATIYDQDTGNLSAQQRGFHASKKPGQTLGNYQEVRIRQLHQTIDKLMAQGN
jgi:phenylpropionate dioxygenase-like ring-hydroxylating dioxygenase large terminal subunit